MSISQRGGRNPSPIELSLPNQSGRVVASQPYFVPLQSGSNEIPIAPPEGERKTFRRMSFSASGEVPLKIVVLNTGAPAADVRFINYRDGLQEVIPVAAPTDPPAARVVNIPDGGQGFPIPGFGFPAGNFVPVLVGDRLVIEVQTGGISYGDGLWALYGLQDIEDEGLVVTRAEISAVRKPVIQIPDDEGFSTGAGTFTGGLPFFENYDTVDHTVSAWIVDADGNDVAQLPDLTVLAQTSLTPDAWFSGAFQPLFGGLVQPRGFRVDMQLAAASSAPVKCFFHTVPKSALPTEPGDGGAF